MSAGETDDTFANECLGPEYSCCSFPLRHDGVVITSTLVEERGIFLERGPEEEGGGGRGHSHGLRKAYWLVSPLS